MAMSEAPPAIDRDRDGAAGEAAPLPRLRLLPVAGGDRRRGDGPSRRPQASGRPHGGRKPLTARDRPWIYANEIDMAPVKALPPGSQVTVTSADDVPIGSAFFSAHSLIAARFYSDLPDRPFDAGLLAQRLAAAVNLRRSLGLWPNCRIVHAEADGLPALVVDRIGAVAVVQVNGAGLDAFQQEIVAAVAAETGAEAVVLRGDEVARQREGLEPLPTRVVQGAIPGPTVLEEDGITFLADPVQGQKTGWYHDQRDHRRQVGRLARGLSVLDLYCHSGGFALHAAAGGAADVTAIDSSAAALHLAEAAAERNGFAGRVRFQRNEVFRALEALEAEGRRFGLVVADPPPFARSRKDVPTATRAYRKLARLAAGRVAPGGFLFLASCSHAVEGDRFTAEVLAGLRLAGRGGRILRQGGAAADHPVHLALPETAYLKAILIQLD